MSSAATARRRFATQTLRLWRDKVGGISGLILDMLIINVTITFILMIVIIRGSSLRSAASVCSHGLPFAHWQSHSHGTCSSLRPNGYGGKVSRFGVFCDDKVAVVVMMLMMMMPEARRQGVTLWRLL